MNGLKYNYFLNQKKIKPKTYKSTALSSILFF